MKDSRIAPKNLNGRSHSPTPSLPPRPAAAARCAPELKQRQDDAAAQVALATAAWKNDQYPAFATALRRALEIDPRFLPGLELLANLNLAQGNLTAVADICSKILEQDKNNVDAMVGLGVFFFHKGNKEMARSSFERVLKLRPTHALALEHLQSLHLAEPSNNSRKAQSVILVNNFNYNGCSAGVRALHYLAALLRAADIPVAVTNRCFYNPTIPVRAQALPDDIVLYPDASRGNSLGAKRICRYMLYFAHAYFGGDRIGKDECPLVFHRNYLADVQAHCDSPVTEDDIITIPILDREWCFPEPKNIENVLYEGKGKGRALPNIDFMVLAAANAAQNHNAPYSDHYAHMRTLAVLRKAKNLYTLDVNTLMSCEAALCGCKVFYVKDANTIEEQTDIMALALSQVMSPGRDVAIGRRFAEKIYGFFEKRPLAQLAARSEPLISSGTSAPACAQSSHEKVEAGVLSLGHDQSDRPYEKLPGSQARIPSHEKPEISIIIPTLNKLELTRQCLRAVQANTPAPRHEIIVVDNGSTDGTGDFLRTEETAGRLHAVFNSENTGFARACNQGARAASGRYLLFLNNDTEPRPNWLGPLFSLAEGDPAVAVVGGKLLFPDGSIQHAGVALADCWDHDPLLAFHLFAKEKADFPLANHRRIYQAVTAACMLARKSHFDQVGGFDEQYWNGYEDVDLCLRLQERGWLTVYEPASEVIHHESQSGPERFRRVAENIERFHRQWLEKASADVIIDQDGKSRISPSSVMRLYVPPSGKLVSIIILAHNQLRDTQQCLASIEKHTSLAHELILVDNGSTDGTGQFFRSHAARHANVRVILNRANLGFSAGNNQGLACARGDTILLLNNDTVATSGWLERMLATLELYPDCGLVGPVSNSVSGPQLVPSADYSGLDQLPKFAAQWCATHAGQSAEAARLVGFCLLLRRAVVERIGGLDPQFGSGNFEDDDLCLRAGLAGFKLRIAQDAFVHHTGGQTFKGAKIDYRASLERNWELFKTKWAMAQDAPLDKGYRLPSAAPQGLVLRLPLPDVKESHVSSLEGRCWTDKMLPETAPKKSSRKPSAVTLPACALIGHLGEAHELIRKKHWAAAWTTTVAAISARPYHPEAYLTLAEIAQAVGDADSARHCAKAARDMAPGWAPPKQFLKGNLHGSSKPEWLKLPQAICDKQAAAGPRISLCLIAKDEERFLPQCLRSIGPLVSQIVVVDTGSTDRTCDIAREFGAEVHSFTWCDDFSAARNAALEHATGDWVLVMDADEELRPEQAAMIAREIQSSAVMGYRLPIIDLGQEQNGCSYVPRLFRNAPGLFFVGRIHEQVFSSIQVRCQQWGLKHQLGKAALLHHGYTSEVMASRKKIERNLRLLERAIDEMPDEPHLVMSLGLELVRSGNLQAGLERYWEAFRMMAALPASEVTPELRETLLTQLTTHLMAAKRYSDVVQLWQNPFAKNGGLTASQHFGLGLAYMEIKQPAEAASHMRQCAAKRHHPALSPINPEILKAGPHHCLALCAISQNDPPGAQRAFDAALAADPSSRPVRFDLARFQAAQGRTGEALKVLQQLTAENPTEPRVWELGGQIALSRPDHLEFARDWTGEAVKNFPENQNLLRQRAEALLLNQDAAGALPLWRRAQDSASVHQRAAVVLCELLTGDSQHHLTAAEEPLISQEAVQWYRQCIRMGAHALINQLHERMETIRLTLPAFVRVLEAAHRQATA
jgi:GT2 family glycosyltransferase/tetratricopeptide (TPR) repeat protein